MKKRIQQRRIPGKYSTKAVVVKTGEHCPMNGWWVPNTVDGVMRSIFEGSIMPAEQGKSVTWTLAASESGSLQSQDTHSAVGASIVR